MLYIFLIYGLSFIVLGIIIFVYPKRISQYALPKNFWLLALFALFHGVHEFTEMFLFFHNYGFVPFRIADLIVLSVSFYFLLQFGINCCITRKGRFIHLLPPVLFLIWAVTTYTVVNNS